MRLPLWVIGLGGMIAASALAVPPIYDTPEKIAGYASAVGASPVSYLMSGRQAAIDTIGGIVANEISQVAQLGICLMVVFLVVRHTRAEEETGRAELLRSTVLGRHAATLAGLLYGVSAALLIGLVTTASMLAAGLDGLGSVDLRRGPDPPRPVLCRGQPGRRPALDLRARSPRPRRCRGRNRLPGSGGRRHAGQRARLGLALRMGPADGRLRGRAVVAGPAAGGADRRVARPGCLAHRAPRLRRRRTADAPRSRRMPRASSARLWASPCASNAGC